MNLIRQEVSQVTANNNDVANITGSHGTTHYRCLSSPFQKHIKYHLVLKIIWRLSVSGYERPPCSSSRYVIDQQLEEHMNIGVLNERELW